MTGLEIAGIVLIGSLFAPVVALAGYGVYTVGTEVIATVGNVLTLPFS